MNDRLSWSHVLYQAEYNYKNNITLANAEDTTQGNMFTNLIAEVFGLILAGLENILGLYSLDELMLNTGNRAYDYYKGTMPTSWFSAASILYALCMLVALIVIGFNIVKLMIQKNMSTINASQRVSLMEGVKDLAITAALLAAFYPAFLIVCQFNYLIVHALYSIVAEKETLQVLLMGKGSSTGFGLGALIITCILFFIELKLNITYVIRAITIGLLFATSPYFISTFSSTGKKEKFWAWLKEMLANIFMQSFDAIIAVFLILILSSSYFRVIERLALAIALTSLSSFFKNSIMRMGSDSEAVADRATGMIASGIGNIAVGLGMGIGHAVNGKGKQSSVGVGYSTGTSKDDSTDGAGVMNQNAYQTIQNAQTNEETVSLSKNGQKERYQQTLAAKEQAQYNSLSPEQKRQADINHGVKESLGHIGHGLGHVVGSLAYTGIHMGTSAVGGRTLMGERKAADSMQAAQDDIFDRGLVGLSDSIKNAYVDEDYGVMGDAFDTSGYKCGNVNFEGEGGIETMSNKLVTDNKGTRSMNGITMNVKDDVVVDRDMTNRILANNKNYDMAVTFKHRNELSESEYETYTMTASKFKEFSASKNSSDIQTTQFHYAGDYSGAKVSYHPVKDDNGEIVDKASFTTLRDRNGKTMEIPDPLSFLR